MKENVISIKENLIKNGIYESEKEIEWLTEEYMSEHEVGAEEKKPFDLADVNEGVVLNFIDYGNHFYTTNNGKRWHWESGKNVPGGNLACGRVDKWYYDVRIGDSYVRGGKCREGYIYFKFDIYH